MSSAPWAGVLDSLGGALDALGGALDVLGGVLDVLDVRLLRILDVLGPLCRVRMRIGDQRRIRWLA